MRLDVGLDVRLDVGLDVADAGLDGREGGGRRGGGGRSISFEKLEKTDSGIEPCLTVVIDINARCYL